MTNVLIVTGRGFQKSIADCCAHDFEDSIADATEATVFVAEEGRRAPERQFDLVVTVGLNFRKMATAYLTAGMPRGRHNIGYVFGGYASHTTRYRSPVKRLLNPRYRAMARLDKVYVGIPDAVDKIADDISLPVSFLPMAANVLNVRASPFVSVRDRPVSVAGFGRLHTGISKAICDRFNLPGASEIYLNNTVNGAAEPADMGRYRATFWQTLRKTRISLAFDHFYANEKNSAEHSYVGPRWFESLAAGTVVAGVAPPPEKRLPLLDWADATIELAGDPQKAADEIEDLLASPERMRMASRRNLENMHRRHDWRHRLADIYADLGLARNARFEDSLETLSRRADEIGGQKDKSGEVKKTA